MFDPRTEFSQPVGIDLDRDRDEIVRYVREIRDLMRTESMSVHELVAAAQLLRVARGGSGAVGGPVPSYTVPLPMSPHVLTEMIYAASVPNLAIKGVLSETVTVPAGSTVALTIPVIPGTVTLFTSGLRVTATYYDPSIVTDAIVDGQNTSPPPYEYAIVGEDTINSLQYTYITQYFSLNITNYTTTSTMITGKAEVLAVDQTLFEKQLWLPLVRHSLNVAKDLGSTYATGG